MLVSPLVAAISSVVIKKWGHSTRPVPFNAAAIFYGSLIMGAVALVVERDQVILPEKWPVLAVLYMATVGTALAFPLYFWLLKHMQARKLALIGYGTPVVALFLGAVFLDEPLTTRALVGSIMVVLGVAVASRGSKR